MSESGHGSAGPGAARQGKAAARLGQVGQGKARQG